ncbi:hypothetical protein ACWD4K_27415 [Streptomyces gelaticus]
MDEVTVDDAQFTVADDGVNLANIVGMGSWFEGGRGGTMHCTRPSRGV